MTVTLRDLDDRQFFCMRGAFGHWWEAVQKPAREGSWGYRIHNRCARCEKEVTIVFDIHERIASRQYRKPTWHRKVSEPYDTSDVRLEAARRQRSRARVPKRRAA